MNEKHIRFWATWFYVGDVPAAPGTLASFVGLLMYVAFYPHMWLCILLFAAVTWIGFKVSGPMEKIMGRKDPSIIVIDEVSGMMLSLLFLPITPAVLWTAFFVFRAFDMFKIYPANKLEEMGGGAGIMMDDIAAGFYTNIVMHIALRLSGVI